MDSTVNGASPGIREHTTGPGETSVYGDRPQQDRSYEQQDHSGTPVRTTLFVT
jgi:hypothetical protein